jgi:hypothetical protein
MNNREIVDAWVIPGIRLKARWVGLERVSETARGALLARGGVDRYIFGTHTARIWTFVNLEAGTIELQDVSEGVPTKRQFATLDYLPHNFEDVVAWARMVVAVRGGLPDE